MNKELIDKVKKFLAVFFGAWALIFINLFFRTFFNDIFGWYIGQTNPLFVAVIVFQMFLIYKYILNK